jgi:hypothetical protein
MRARGANNNFDADPYTEAHRLNMRRGSMEPSRGTTTTSSCTPYASIILLIYINSF